jgi:hypothetical protein
MSSVSMFSGMPDCRAPRISRRRVSENRLGLEANYVLSDLRQSPSGPLFRTSAYSCACRIRFWVWPPSHRSVSILWFSSQSVGLAHVSRVPAADALLRGLLVVVDIRVAEAVEDARIVASLSGMASCCGSDCI